MRVVPPASRALVDLFSHCVFGLLCKWCEALFLRRKFKIPCFGKNCNVRITFSDFDAENKTQFSTQIEPRKLLVQGICFLTGCCVSLRKCFLKIRGETFACMSKQKEKSQTLKCLFTVSSSAARREQESLQAVFFWHLALAASPIAALACFAFRSAATCTRVSMFASLSWKQRFALLVYLRCCFDVVRSTLLCQKSQVFVKSACNSHISDVSGNSVIQKLVNGILIFDYPNFNVRRILWCMLEARMKGFASSNLGFSHFVDAEQKLLKLASFRCVANRVLHP